MSLSGGRTQLSDKPYISTDRYPGTFTDIFSGFKLKNKIIQAYLASKMFKSLEFERSE